MSEIIELVQKKFIEDIGIFFSIYDIFVFILYLVYINELIFEFRSEILSAIMSKNLSELFFDNKSIFLKSRLIDFVISFFLTFFTVFIYKKINMYSFKYLSNLKCMKEYINNLQIINSKTTQLGSNTEIILKEKKKFLKINISRTNGLGIILLSVVIILILTQFLLFNLLQIIISIILLIVVLFCQWRVFCVYTSKIIPILVIEKSLSGDPLRFEDEAPV